MDRKNDGLHDFPAFTVRQASQGARIKEEDIKEYQCEVPSPPIRGVGSQRALRAEEDENELSRWNRDGL